MTVSAPDSGLGPCDARARRPGCATRSRARARCSPTSTADRAPENGAREIAAPTLGTVRFLGADSALHSPALCEVPVQILHVVEPKGHRHFLTGCGFEDRRRRVERLRHEKAQLPFRQRPEQLGVPVHEGPEVHRRRPVDQVEEYVADAIRHTDGQLLGEVPDGHARRRAERDQPLPRTPSSDPVRRRQRMGAMLNYYCRAA